jgi:hypothetical protein
MNIIEFLYQPVPDWVFFPTLLGAFAFIYWFAWTASTPPKNQKKKK